MTEPRGRAARWQTAVLLVPGAAVTFGAAVAWAASGTPNTGSASGTPVAPTSHQADRAARAHANEVAAYRHRLELQIREHRRNAHQLQHRLAVLRTRTAQLGQSTVGLQVPIAPVGGGPVAQGPVVVVPPPPPPVVVAPPPVHTVTGASGHP